jgi:lipopolysaccharide assembly outer membrane protein LptD (OstA)
MYTATKDPRGVMVMQADEVDLNQITGDIFPRGNVRLTIEGVK